MKKNSFHKIEWFVCKETLKKLVVNNFVEQVFYKRNAFLLFNKHRG